GPNCARLRPSSAYSRRRTDLSKPNVPSSLPLHLLGVTRTQDVFRRPLVLARLGALGRLAPRRDRMTAALGAAFAAAMRMGDRIPRRAAHRGPTVAPHIAARLGENLVHMIGIGHGANGCLALEPHAPHFARIQAQQRIARIAAEILRIGSRGARNLSALA